MADCHAQLKPHLFPRAVAQSRRRRGARAAAAHHRPGVPGQLRHPGQHCRRLHAELGRLRGAGQDLRPRRRHGSHGDPGQAPSAPSAAPTACCCSTAATRCRAPTRRSQSQGRRHGRRHARARRRGHHRPLGVHARAPSASASCSATSDRRARRACRSWPATCATPISTIRCFDGDAPVREGRRHHRRDRPGVSRTRRSPIRAG